MNNVIIEAENCDDIVWPSTCVCCGQKIGSQDSETKHIKMEYGLLGGFYQGPDSLSFNICNKCASNRAHKQSVWLSLSLITSALFILLLFVTIALISSQSVPPQEISDARILCILLGLICFFIAIFSWSSWSRLTESEYWKLIFRCIRKSKTKWLFQIANDLYANQFIEAEEQRRKEEYQRKQQETLREGHVRESQIETKSPLKSLIIAAFILVFCGIAVWMVMGKWAMEKQIVGRWEEPGRQNQNESFEFFQDHTFISCCGIQQIGGRWVKVSENRVRVDCTVSGTTRALVFDDIKISGDVINWNINGRACTLTRKQ